LIESKYLVIAPLIHPHEKNDMPNKFLRRIIFITVLFSSLLFREVAYSQAEKPIVHALLFFSPTCGHCHKVITEDLPPLIEKYGDQLQILGINVSTPEGQKLYQSAIREYQMPDPVGVPMLIIGQSYFIGSIDIPKNLPIIIEDALRKDGIPWPDIPGLSEILSQAEEDNSTTNQPTSSITPSPANSVTDSGDSQLVSTAEANHLASDSKDLSGNIEEGHVDNNPISIIGFGEKFIIDPLGNSFAVIILLFMIISLAFVVYKTLKPAPVRSKKPGWLLPLLSIIGLVIAIYLSYVEITLTEAFCGPVGDCNTVQQSEYAHLFGYVPIGILGIIGYSLILGSWGLYEFGPAQWRKIAAIAKWVLALLGTAFSVYLTFLEPFIIGATCAWCITSAIIMTVLLWVSTPPIQQPS
jgi:uncharacterized membrane protein/thiol-disulfide isomerase/thioredoxin